MYKNEISIVIFWIAALVVAYTFWTPGYIRELIPPLTLTSALLIAYFPWKDVPKIIAALGVFSIFGLYGTSLAWYREPLTGGWTWTRESISEVSSFLAVHTHNGESIFTANPLPVLIAGRSVFLNLYSSDIYLAPGFDERYGISITPHELYTSLLANPPAYAVIDIRMQTYIYKPYSIFEEFIKTHYTLVESFGERKREIQIWRRR